MLIVKHRINGSYFKKCAHCPYVFSSPRSLRAPPTARVSSNGSVGSVSALGSTMQSSLPSGHGPPPQTAPIFSPVGGDNRSTRSQTSEFSFLNYSNDRYRSPSIPCTTDTPWN